MMMSLPGGQIVSGFPHRLKGDGRSCGESVGTIFMGLNDDPTRLAARPESPYVHMHAQCRLQSCACMNV